MLLGAFLDAGAHLETLTGTMQALGLGDAAEVSASQRMKGSLRATHVDIEVTAPQAWRHVGEIDSLIAAAPLDEGVKERSRLAFRLLAGAEARAHNVPVESVRLHEAGAVDAVIDVVGTFALAHELGVEAFFSSALPLSDGETESAHGRIPLPAPATVNILESVAAPTYHKDGGGELVTPTGAAILGACARFESPRIEAELEGYGAGTADLDWPNVLRLTVGELVEPEVEESPAAPVLSTGPTAWLASPSPTSVAAPLVDLAPGLERDTVAVLETNIDDMPANLLSDVLDAMLAAGALDAFVTPVVMKKGRSAHLLTVLCEPAAAAGLAARLIAETSTLGVRVRHEERYVAGRRLERFKSSIGGVGVKLKLVGGDVVDAVPEHDDVLERAADAGIPIAEAHRRVTDEARRKYVKPR
jgi:uncharacterized protein (TIGR00299 family) protein